MGSAFKLGTELVAAVVVGTIIGFILDNWFDTKPWFIIISFFGNGCRNIKRNTLQTDCKKRTNIRNLWQNPMQQFSVHKIGPEIKIAGVDLSLQTLACL